jgi:hypothetical protein
MNSVVDARQIFQRCFLAMMMVLPKGVATRCETCRRGFSDTVQLLLRHFTLLPSRLLSIISHPIMASQTPGDRYHHSNTCMVYAFFCGHAGLDLNCDRFVCLSAVEEDCICIRRSFCLAPGRVPSRGAGCVTDRREGSDEICKVGLICCDYGLIKPGCTNNRSLCSGTAKSCCFYSVYAFPFHEDIVPEPVCAYKGVQCAPRCACCAPPPKSVSLDHIIGYTNPATNHVLQVMERGGDDGVAFLVGEETPVSQQVGGYPVAAAVLVEDHDDGGAPLVATSMQEMARPLLDPSKKN